MFENIKIVFRRLISEYVEIPPGSDLLKDLYKITCFFLEKDDEEPTEKKTADNYPKKGILV